MRRVDGRDLRKETRTAAAGVDVHAIVLCSLTVLKMGRGCDAVESK